MGGIFFRIHPHSFDASISGGFSSNKTASVWPSYGYHKPANFNILTSMIGSECCEKREFYFSIHKFIFHYTIYLTLEGNPRFLQPPKNTLNTVLARLLHDASMFITACE